VAANEAQQQIQGWNTGSSSKVEEDRNKDGNYTEKQLRLQEDYDRYKRMNKPLVLEIHLSPQGPLGNLEGVRLPGLLRDKKSMSGFLSWTQRPLRF
jgi:hypothetical protein